MRHPRLAATLILLSGARVLWAAGPVVQLSVSGPPFATRVFERYARIPLGQPRSADAIRSTVELLYATGSFQDIIVTERALDRGVELHFDLVPNPRLARVRVAGDRLLSPARIEAISGLREGEALWPARLEEARAAVEKALEERGFLERRVAVTSVPTTQPNEAVFTIQTGNMTHLAAVAVTGVDALTAARLSEAVALVPGMVYSRRALSRAREAMLDQLRRAGFWLAEVEVREAHPRAGAVEVAFEVRRGPRVEVLLRGPDPGAARREVVDLLRAGALRADLIDDAAERLAEAFRRRGHRNVTVVPDRTEERDKITIGFTIVPGTQWRAASVALAGDVVAGVSRVLTVRAGAPIQDAQIDSDVQALDRLLEGRGYLSASVSAELPERGGDVPVVFRIRAGVQTLVQSLTVESPVALDRVPKAPLAVGQVLRTRDLARYRTDLTTAYRNAGYAQVDIQTETTLSPDGRAADLRLVVRPGPRLEVGEIIVAGLTHSREEVVRRELTFREGETLRQDRLLESQRRLSSLGIFSRVTLSELEVESTERTSLVVGVEEAPRTTVAYGLGAAGLGQGYDTLLRASAEVTRRNLGGLDRSLSAFLRFSFKGSRLLASYREPYPLGRKVDLSITAFREEEERESFSYDRLGGGVQTTHLLSPSWNLAVRYSFSRTRTLSSEIPVDEIDRQYRDSRFSGPSLSIINDTRSDPLDPGRGHFLGADVQFTHAVLGGSSYAKGFVQAATYRPLASFVLAAAGVRLGAIQTFRGETLAPPDRFYAGGDFSMRGFATDGVQPAGGVGLLVGSFELRWRLTKAFSFATFTDIGNVYSGFSRQDLNDLRYVGGVGLRYRSALGPIRLDWGQKLDRRAGESRGHLHITVGHAF